MAAAVASTTVRVEKATSDLLIGPDWTVNMDICDSINTNHWLAKDAVKSVKKRLQNKEPKVQFLALTLLETMIKNCGDFVHLQVVEREVPQEMIKMARKKQTDMQVREKILVLLDSWQEAFGGPSGKYPQYYWAYADLKKSGVVFPPRSEDSALIFTPPITHPVPRHTQTGPAVPGNSSMSLDEAMAYDMGNLSLSDLDNIRDVACLLSEMLRAVDPKDSEAVRDEVIADLVSQCQSNQKRITLLIESTGEEQLLAEALTLNDHIQGLIAKHDAIASGSPSQTPESVTSPKTPPVTTIIPVTHYEDEEEDDGDDEFAQLARRNSTLNRPAVYRATSEAGTWVDGSDNTGPGDELVACNALVLTDPPVSIMAPSKEDEMIELLSITLSTATTSSTPQAPQTLPSASHQIGPATTAQPYSIDQVYNPYNSYVAPWARPSAPSPRLQPVPSSQPRPPWEEDLAVPHPQPEPTSSMPIIQPQIPQPSSSKYPPPPWAIPSSAGVGSSIPYSSTSYQFQSAAENTTSPFMQQGNSNQREPASSSSASKPYIPPYRLFEDLIEMRNPDGSLKTVGPPPTLMGPSPGRGMISERK